MSYYESNGQWSGQGQNHWDHQTPPPQSRPGTNGPPQPQEEFAFTNQFEEVDRAFENLTKGGKAYGPAGRRDFMTQSPSPSIGGRPRPNVEGRIPAHGGQRPLSMNSFDDVRFHGQPNLQNFYAPQRHSGPRGSSEAEQAMQATRRMAAQRERDLRNLHTQKQFHQRSVVADSTYGSKSMSEEETRQLIARQRSALYGEGSFAENGGYVDETGIMRNGAPGSGVPSVRGNSPMTIGRPGQQPPKDMESNTPVSAGEMPSSALPGGDLSTQSMSNASPQPNSVIGGGAKSVFDGHASQISRTSTSSPGDISSKQDLATASKPSQANPAVAPIGTRPSTTTAAAASSAANKRSTTPLASPGGWGRGNAVWGQSAGLGAQASVWG